jgi:chitinase
MEGIAQNVKGMGLVNFGGVMFWDGPEGMLNEYDNRSIIAWTKAGLTM